jgi:hypothetical protein
MRGQKRVREHKGKGPKVDERESGTICNANISIIKKAKCRCTIDVISTRVAYEKVKAKD